jgi:ribosome production factor 1
VQLFAGNDADEFNAVLQQHITPKVLITTCRFNSGVCVFYASDPCFMKNNILFHMFLSLYLHLSSNSILSAACVQRGPAFIEELTQVIPNSHYVKRGTYELKKVCHFTELNFDFVASMRIIFS